VAAALRKGSQTDVAPDDVVGGTIFESLLVVVAAGCFRFIVGVDFFIVYIISSLLLLLFIVCSFDVNVLTSKTELILYSLCSHVIG